MAGSMAQALAEATPLRKTPITHVSLIGRRLNVRFADESMNGRCLAASAPEHDGGRLLAVDIREVSRPAGKFARGISRVADCWAQWTDDAYGGLRPFGVVALPRTINPVAEHGVVSYRAVIPADLVLRAPSPRRMRSSAAPRPSDPFLAAWDHMTRIEDEINKFLAEHPDLEVVMERRGHARFRRR